MPRSSPVDVTYAESSQFPLSLRGKAFALRHVERMYMTRGGKVLVNRLRSLLEVPGIRSKGHAPRAALLQETCALIKERYSGLLHLYTNGSVNRHGSAAAASIIPALRDERKCRLLLPASSTTAEFAA
ncbi:hypothetical protein MRX96_000207 [Rhipicephalus microplus]